MTARFRGSDGGGAQALVLSFKRFKTLANGLKHLRQLFFCVTWCDVLRAVPIEGLDLDYESALGG